MKKITDKDIYFAIDERIDRVVEQLEDKFDACCQCIDKNNKKISLLNDLGKLESSKLKDLDTLLINMIDVLEERIKYLEKVDKSYKSDIDDLKRYTDKQLCHVSDKYDDLEAKNYQLRRELDGVYKVLEMDACDIQALQDKVLNGYTREQNKMESK